jgi:hypothetical protein
MLASLFVRTRATPACCAAANSAVAGKAVAAASPAAPVAPSAAPCDSASATTCVAETIRRRRGRRRASLLSAQPAASRSTVLATGGDERLSECGGERVLGASLVQAEGCTPLNRKRRLRGEYCRAQCRPASVPDGTTFAQKHTSAAAAGCEPSRGALAAGDSGAGGLLDSLQAGGTGTRLARCSGHERVGASEGWCRCSTAGQPQRSRHLCAAISSTRAACSCCNRRLSSGVATPATRAHRGPERARHTFAL